MSRHIVLVVPGLDPVRVLRVAVTLGGTDLVIPVTSSADHWVQELAGLLEEVGLEQEVHQVPVDEWHFGSVLEALRTAVGGLRAEGDLFDAVIGGGTKPIAAAVGVLAEESAARCWVLDDWGRRLVGETEVALVEPAVNISPERLGQLYAVHHALPEGEPPDDETLLQWLRGYFDHGVQGKGAEVDAHSRTFESAVVALLRAVVADDHDVWGPQAFVLRDPASPTEPALDDDGSGRWPYRQFEVDGTVVRGTQMWVVESKFIGKELKQTKMRTAFAELDRRRSDLGGATATGVLVVLNDAQAQGTPEGPTDAFTPAGIEVLGRSDLRAALDAVDSGDAAAVAATEVARVFRRRSM
jgi:hypothetical protein